ncbi:glycoside hydrolase family 19 protein [uncultured Empedobacter sp.]|uniref:glycoside hydrolase family 19 protein n=1 Tax=uncultured Empedobacter sp. TaxID=410844 RepID=UPI002600F933|nr:glycoside hydrolase family 19 protein [uncultured Empedobacter sp.]
MINRKATFDNIRKEFSKLNIKQVQGFDANFDEFELWLSNKWIDKDSRKLAYILATDWHEGNKTMQPIKEIGSNAYFVKKYWENKKIAKELGNLSAQDAINYCGKGKPQLTGRSNYAKMGKILGYDLVKNPDLMFDLKIATEVMFEGMLTGRSFKGDFTGRQLENYFNKTTNDPIGARRVVNGTDKSELIAGYHYKFLKSIVFV